MYAIYAYIGVVWDMDQSQVSTARSTLVEALVFWCLWWRGGAAIEFEKKTPSLLESIVHQRWRFIKSVTSKLESWYSISTCVRTWYDIWQLDASWYDHQHHQSQVDEDLLPIFTSNGFMIAHALAIPLHQFFYCTSFFAQAMHRGRLGRVANNHKPGGLGRVQTCAGLAAWQVQGSTSWFLMNQTFHAHTACE